MSTLRIYFSSQWSESTSPCPWALCDDQGVILQSGTSPLASLPKGHDCTGIVAADKVLMIAAAVPQGGYNRLRAVLPFVVEEFSLADPEENHVVPGPVLADGRRVLSVMDKLWLESIVTSARDAKLSLRRMVAETILPVTEKDSWVLVCGGFGCFVKTGNFNGTILDNGDEDSMPLSLRMNLDAAPKLPDKIEVRFNHDVATGGRNMPEWSDLPIPMIAGADLDWRTASIPDDAVNLMWGDFIPRAKIQEWWPKLRPAVVLLLAILAVEIMGNNIEWLVLAKEKNLVTREMQKTFRATFGDSVALVNAPLQMQRNLAELRHVAGVPDTGDFLPLLNLASWSLASLPAGSVMGIHYESGRLDIDLKLARIADFASLQSDMLNRGLVVRLGEVRDEGNGAEAKLTVSPEGMP